MMMARVLLCSCLQTKEANPELKTTEISKVLGEKWGKMDAEAKGPYNELAQNDKERCVVVHSKFI